MMFGLPNLQIYPLKHDHLSKGGDFEGLADRVTAIKDVAAHALEKFIKGDVLDSNDPNELNGDKPSSKQHSPKDTRPCNRVPETNSNASDVDTSLESYYANRWETTTDASESVTHDASNEGNSTETDNKDTVEEAREKLFQSDSRLKTQHRKYMKVITFLSRQNQRYEEELFLEKQRRAIEFTRIVKSLLCFEAKLKHDKKVINEKLFEKDNEISKLLNLNKSLRQKLGVDCDADLGKSSQLEASYCVKCRKNYYGIEGVDISTQTFHENYGMKDDPIENEGSSSDETVSTSFSGARRSVRYTSKRSFGSFRDYLKSRSMMIDDGSPDNYEDKGSILSYDESTYSYDGGDLHAFSKRIDQMHGVRNNRQTDNIKQQQNDQETNVDDDKSCKDGTEFHENGVSERSVNCKFKEFSESSPKHEFETSTDDWYASASDVEDSDNVRAKPYGSNAVNPVLECVNQILLQQSMEEAIVDGPPSLESYENNSNNRCNGAPREQNVSVRKRVHFSTKNSMVHVPRDDSISERSNMSISGSDNQKDCNPSYESIYSNEYEPIGSEQNSSNHYVDMESKLGHDDREKVKPSSMKTKQPPALPPKPANLLKFKRNIRNSPQLNSNNVKESKIIKAPSTIGTESEPDYCSISEVNETIINLQVVAADVHKSADEDIISNCSEEALQKTNQDDGDGIFADIPKLPNVAAIIAPKEDESCGKVSGLSTSSPAKNNVNKIEDSNPTDNVCPIKPTSIVPDSQHVHKHNIPNILTEINKKPFTGTNALHLSPSKHAIIPLSPSKIKQSQSVKACLTNAAALSGSINLGDDKMPLQAEFDWYNLDAEYNKSNQPDVIKETDVNGLDFENNETSLINEVDHNSNCNISVEYNLDEEFSLINQPDIVKENVLEPKISSSSTSSSPSTISTVATVCTRFPTIVDQTPCCNQSKAKMKKNFVSFIDNSGLSNKPLPRQRKIYFSGPFV